MERSKVAISLLDESTLRPGLGDRVNVTTLFEVHREAKTVMKIDINKLSEEELVDLNHRVRTRRCWTSRSATVSLFSRKRVRPWLESSPAITRNRLLSSQTMDGIGTCRQGFCPGLSPLTANTPATRR